MSVVSWRYVMTGVVKGTETRVTGECKYQYKAFQFLFQYHCYWSCNIMCCLLYVHRQISASSYLFMDPLCFSDLLTFSFTALEGEEAVKVRDQTHTYGRWEANRSLLHQRSSGRTSWGREREDKRETAEEMEREQQSAAISKPGVSLPLSAQ